MKRIIILFSIVFSTFSVFSQRVGLVLSGGGARGIAHIGLIQALEDNNIPIDYITGTSMGAIVGAMYAMGYTSDEMIALLKSDEFKLWQTGKIDERMINYFKTPEPDPSFFKVNTNISDSIKLHSFLPQSLINPLPMNFAFMKLFSNATIRIKNDFNNLFVPFRAVASDVYNKRAIIFKNGNLGDAVRASMSFPFVFKPIEINGILVYDGGIYNNYPVDIMKEDFAPDFIIGSAVSENPTKPKEDDLMNQIENMVMQKTNYSIDSIDGISIQFKINDVSLLDFQKASEIYKIGYDKGIEYIAKIKEHVHRISPKEEVALNRLNYRSQDPDIIFDDVIITGVTTAQSNYLKGQFIKDDSHHLTMKEAEEAYFGLLSDKKIKDIMPSVVPNLNGGYNLRLNVKLNQDIETCIGGLVTSTNANRIYLGVNYRIISGFAADMGLSTQLGKSYNTFRANSRVWLPFKYPLYLDIKYAYIGQKYYESEHLFALDDSPCFIQQREHYGKLEIGLPLGKIGKMIYGGGYGYLKDEYYQSNQTDFALYRPDQSIYKLWNLNAGFEINRITAKDYPTEGFLHRLKGNLFSGKESYTPSSLREENASQPFDYEDNKMWFKIAYQNQTYIKIAKKFSLGISGDLVVSNKPFLSNYTATILQAPSFTPTLHSQTIFNGSYRANNFLAIGVKPIYKINDLIHFRTEFYAFQPYKKFASGENNSTYYQKFQIKPNYIGEFAAVLKLPFATISGFIDYYSAPKTSFNFGINIGFLLNTPRFCD